jgi:hypothetical protein
MTVYEISPTPPPSRLLRSQVTVRQGPDSLLVYLVNRRWRSKVVLHHCAEICSISPVSPVSQLLPYGSGQPKPTLVGPLPGIVKIDCCVSSSTTLSSTFCRGTVLVFARGLWLLHIQPSRQSRQNQIVGIFSCNDLVTRLTVPRFV